MDAIRQIRFITPGLLFVGILVIGALFETPAHLELLAKLQPAMVVAVIGTLLAAMFPLGFIIGAVTSLCLRVAFWIWGRRNYQIELSEGAWRSIWRALRLNADLPATASHKLYAAMTFDHELLAGGVHETSVRLWSAFNIAANSAMGLLLACVVNYLWLHIRWSHDWIGLIVFLAVILVLVAAITWREHMGLLEFQSLRLDRAGLMPHHHGVKTKRGDEDAA